jgi:hypothetical protein
MATIVLAHGAWSAAWAWKAAVSRGRASVFRLLALAWASGRISFG